jgi:hypothetical protein
MFAALAFSQITIKNEAPMRRLRSLVTGLLLLGALGSHRALGQTIVGVNVPGAQYMTSAQQDAFVALLQENGVKAVRTGLGGNFTHFIIEAYHHGIGVVANLNVNYPGVPARPADQSLGLSWGALLWSAADPTKLKESVSEGLAPLEAAGVRLIAFEVGNEINGPFFNGDFTVSGSGRIMGLSDLDNPHDQAAQKVASGFRAYVNFVSAVKEARAGSKLNHTTPIISAGLVDPGLPGPRPGQKLDGVSIPATIQFLRRSGLDKLVDGYGVHGGGGGTPSTPVSARVAQLAQDTFAECSTSKPCWLTEWSFANGQSACPVDDSVRLRLIESMRGALQQYAKQRKLAAILFYSWAGPPTPSGIFRCGALTQAGKLALSPL